MREVSISQLWNRAWDLFKGNWVLFMGLYVLLVSVTFISIYTLIPGLVFLRFLILSFIDSRFFILGFIGLSFFTVSFIGLLIVPLILMPAFVRAGYLVARHGQLSFGEAFRDISLLLKVFVYYLILELVPGILIGVGYILLRDSAWARSILVVVGSLILFILNLFGWAGPYAILSGRAGIFGAIGQSFSLTWRNFDKVFVALLSVIGLLISGLLPLKLGLLMEVPILILGGVPLYGLWLLVVGPMTYVFLPLLYLALTGEEGVSHS
jgi:hypothetical protein